MILRRRLKKFTCSSASGICVYLSACTVGGNCDVFSVNLFNCYCSPLILYDLEAVMFRSSNSQVVEKCVDRIQEFLRFV